MLYSVEDLVINDSFIAYCTKQKDADMVFWDQYLEQYPEALPAVEEARLLVLGLKFMLQKKQDELSAGDEKSGHALYIPEAVVQPLTPVTEAPSPLPIRRIGAWAAITAGVIIVATIFFRSGQPGFNLKEGPAKAAVTPPALPANSRALRTMELPDKSVVTLNTGSSLKLSEDFGNDNRDVYLDGEAFFDVAHNKRLPFIVHVKKYKVKVLGTRFNVKAYANDAVSETSLLEGSVQILVNRDGKDKVYKTLQVNQKFTTLAESSDVAGVSPTGITGAVVPLSGNDGQQPVETAWTKELMIFDGQTMEEIKNTLERKFDVKIIIADKQIRRYTYSASFSKETIDEILNALQLSYPFTYKKEGNTIIINK